MGLLVTDVTLRDFRNFERLDLTLSPAVTVLVGPNAVGKTNTVEAVQLLTSGASFRRPTPLQLVREGASSARIDARLVGDGRVVDHRLDAAAGVRRFSRNGKRVRAADMPEALPSVLFAPDALALVKGGASQRRVELDLLGRQVSRGYAHVLAEYQRSVDQRNRLLREDRPDPPRVDAGDGPGGGLGAGRCCTSYLSERSVPFDKSDWRTSRGRFFLAYTDRSSDTYNI